MLVWYTLKLVSQSDSLHSLESLETAHPRFGNIMVVYRDHQNCVPVSRPVLKIFIAQLRYRACNFDALYIFTSKFSNLKCVAFKLSSQVSEYLGCTIQTFHTGLHPYCFLPEMACLLKPTPLHMKGANLFTQPLMKPSDLYTSPVLMLLELVDHSSTIKASCLTSLQWRPLSYTLRSMLLF